MRKLTDHIVKGDSANHQLEVRVLDEPGAGGACHEYAVVWGDDANAHKLITFQNGPIDKAGVNGITHEALLAILIDRLRSFQAGPFACRENEAALEHVTDALWWLKKRTSDRIARGVEGSSEK